MDDTTSLSARSGEMVLTFLGQSTPKATPVQSDNHWSEFNMKTNLQKLIYDCYRLDHSSINKYIQ